MTIALTSGKSLQRSHILFTAQERNARCYKTESVPLRFLLARELKVLPKEFFSSCLHSIFWSPVADKSPEKLLLYCATSSHSKNRGGNDNLYLTH